LRLAFPRGAAVPACLLAVMATACTAGSASAPAPAEPAASPASAEVAHKAQACVDTVNTRDLNALVSSFARDAEIVDVPRGIRGHDAIRA
jgi:hypothetical protein